MVAKPNRESGTIRSPQSDTFRRNGSPSRVPAAPLKADQAWSHRGDAGEEWLLLRLSSPLNAPIAQSRLLGHWPVHLVAAGDLTVTLDLTPPVLRARQSDAELTAGKPRLAGAPAH